MTVYEKLQEVASYAENGRILLLREGMFWKAYQEAAYLFVTYLRSYQVNRTYVKKVKTDVLSLGFPVPSTSKVLSTVSYHEEGDMLLISIDSPFDEGDYIRWRDEVIVQPPVSRKPSADTLLAYKHAYDLMIHFCQDNRNVDREYKFSLSEKIKEELHEVLMSICFANEEDDRDKKSYLLSKSIETLTSVKIRIRLLHDLKQLPLKHYAAMAEKITDLLSELKKWRTAI